MCMLIHVHTQVYNIDMCEETHGYIHLTLEGHKGAEL